LAELKDGTDAMVQREGTNLFIKLQEQASLTASKELTGLIIIAGIIWLFFLFIRYTYKKLKAYPPL